MNIGKSWGIFFVSWQTNEHQDHIPTDTQLPLCVTVTTQHQMEADSIDPVEYLFTLLK
jgi:hypothetical protein